MPRLSIDFQESDNPRSGVLLCGDSLASGGGGGGRGAVRIMAPKKLQQTYVYESKQRDTNHS